jgi:hypothetical protein
MRRPVAPTSIVTVDVLSFLVQQIISVPLFFYELVRGKQNLPLDTPGYNIFGMPQQAELDVRDESGGAW